jgi:hypothetical protein
VGAWTCAVAGETEACAEDAKRGRGVESNSEVEGEDGTEDGWRLGDDVDGRLAGRDGAGERRGSGED